MNEETLKTLVPPAGVRAKLLHKIKKLNDESTEVRTTEARPIHEDANAETVGEASSAPSVEKNKVRTYLHFQKGQSQTSSHFRNGYGSRRGEICQCCPCGSHL